MHLNTLLNHLKAKFGEPVRLAGQDAFRWDVRQSSGSSYHICLTLEQATRRASIWVFNPDRPAEAQTYYLGVESQSDLGAALQRIDELCPSATA